MDNDTDEKKYREFLTQLKDNKNEEYLKNLSEECRPEKFVEFEDIIPISAKFNRKSVDYVKDRLRVVVDEADAAKNSKLPPVSKQTILKLNKFGRFR